MQGLTAIYKQALLDPGFRIFKHFDKAWPSVVTTADGCAYPACSGLIAGVALSCVVTIKRPSRCFRLTGNYVASIAAIRRRDVATHMRCIICIALVLLPAGLARMLGYQFGVRQSTSQTICLGLIDAFLLALIVIEAIWVTLGRPV